MANFSCFSNCSTLDWESASFLKTLRSSSLISFKNICLFFWWLCSTYARFVSGHNNLCRRVHMPFQNGFDSGVQSLVFLDSNHYEYYFFWSVIIKIITIFTFPCSSTKVFIFMTHYKSSNLFVKVFHSIKVCSNKLMFLLLFHIVLFDIQNMIETNKQHLYLYVFLSQKRHQFFWCVLTCFQKLHYHLHSHLFL